MGVSWIWINSSWELKGGSWLLEQWGSAMVFQSEQNHKHSQEGVWLLYEKH